MNEKLKYKLGIRLTSLGLPLIFGDNHNTIFNLVYTTNKKEERIKLQELIAITDDELKNKVDELIEQYYDAIENYY